MNQPHQNDVASFFDSISVQYDGMIERCVPRYREMIWALLTYLPKQLEVSRILELGCGTGNLSSVLAQRFPQAEITMVDISSEMLENCRQRLGQDSRFTFRVADLNNLDFDAASFDLVTSSIAIHHINSAAKAALFQRVHSWLREDGVFAYSDQFAGATTELYQTHLEFWRSEALKLGATDDDWNVWMQHQDDADFHDPLIDQIDWLRAAGFQNVDCPWRFLLWTVVLAQKS